MKVKYGFHSSDEITLTIKDIFLLLIGKKINGKSATNISMYRKPKQNMCCCRSYFNRTGKHVKDCVLNE